MGAMGSRRIRLIAFAALALLGAAILAVSATGQTGPTGPGAAPGPAESGEPATGIAYSFTLDDAISPATESWVASALDDAVAADADVAILQLDTPGGLDSSTREIVQQISAAPPRPAPTSPRPARSRRRG